MADPRFFAVKTCPPQYGSKRGATIGAATTNRRNIMGAIGKAGDLEVLNSVGGSKIGEGLRTLASISNSVRSGCGSMPTTIGGLVGSAIDKAEAGASWVLDQVGIGSDKLEAVSKFSPEMANRALGQAKQIYEMTQRGSFKFSDIPGAMQDLQNLERLARNIFTPSSWYDRNKFSAVCEASPYAVDLISKAPKHKFLFVVQFRFNSGYNTFDQFSNDFAFVVKKSTRPSIRFDMEDVNYYNFRSKFVTKTAFEEMQMTFHDDGSEGNSGVQFATAYTRAMSPITNIGPEWSQMTNVENDSMNFDSSTTIDGTWSQGMYNSSSSGPLQEGNKTVLTEVVMYHVYSAGRKVNIYHFFNPRITQLVQDDVDMSSSDGNEIQVNFAYDSVYTELGVDMASINNRMIDIQGGSGAVYKMRSVGTIEEAGTAPQAYSASQTVPAQPSCDPANKINTSLPGASASNREIAPTGPINNRAEQVV